MSERQRACSRCSSFKRCSLSHCLGSHGKKEEVVWFRYQVGLTIGSLHFFKRFVPPLIYPLLGTSRDLAMGPMAVVALLLGSLLQKEIDPKTHPLEYKRLAFTATFFAGITQAALGFFRLGFIIEFLSHAAIIGFMGGAAIIIALQQLKGFLGIKNFTNNTDIVSVMKSTFKSARHGASL